MKEILDQLEGIIERAKRPGVLGFAGMKVERDARRDLKTYFTELAGKVGIDRMAQLADTGTSKESAGHVVEMVAGRGLRTLRPWLKSLMAHHYIKAVQTARAHEHLAEAQPFTKKGDTLFDAAAWAEEQAAELVKGMDQVTIDRLAAAVSEGIQEQLGVQGTSRLLRDVLRDMSVDRAAMIASTEINRAMSLATLDKLGADGFGWKRIILSPDACPICEENAAQGAIPIDEDFESGDGEPPFHPNCRCAVTAARAPEQSESGVDDEPRDDRGRWTDAMGIGPGDRVQDEQGLKHTVHKVEGNKIITTSGAELHTHHVQKIEDKRR